MISLVSLAAMLRRFLRPESALLAMCLLSASGCGGGSGSGSGPALLQGDTAIRAAAVGGYKALGAGAAYPYSALMIASPTGSTIHGKAATAIVALLKHTSTISRVVSQRSGTLTYIPSLNLYAGGGDFVKNVATASYYTDAAGTQSAGAITITLPTSVSSLPDPTAYPSYPAVVNVAVSLTAGNLPCAGNIVVSFGGPTGANTMTGSMTLTKDDVVIDVNLALSTQLDVSGTITVHENGATIQMTDVTGNVLNPLTANITVSPYGWTGTGTINLTTGALTVKLNTGTGNSTAASDASGNLDLTFADGTNQTVNNAYTASLTSSGGSTGGGATASYNAPFIFQAAQRTITMINGSGQSIGFVTPGTPVFWSSPTAQPQTLALPNGLTYVAASAMNDSGQIVGFANTGGSNSAALYWSSPTAQPVKLSTPANTSTSTANCINNSGQIVGYCTVGTSQLGATTGLYWATSTAQPTSLTSSSGAYPSYIGPAGQIIDSTDSLFWTSSTSAPRQLPALPTDSQGASPMGVNASGLIVGASIPGGGVSHAVTWASATAPPVALPIFTQVNATDYQASAASINSSGVIVGAFYGYTAGTSNIYFVAALWQNGKVTDLNTLIPSGNSATLTSAAQITDSGWILGKETQNPALVSTGQYILQPKQ